MRAHLVVALATALSVGSLTAGRVLADREIVVQPGESIESISRRYYGDDAHVQAIARANHLASPESMYAGMRLVLPDLADDMADATLYAQSFGPVAQSTGPLPQTGGINNASAGPPPVHLSQTSGTGPLAHPVALAVLTGPGSPESAPAPGVLPLMDSNTPGRLLQIGLATWYGPGFSGEVTFCGDVYDQWSMTAASNTLPCGSVVVVTNQDTGQSVRVRITDHGAFGGSVVLDLSRAAFLAISPSSTGVIVVNVSQPAR